MIEKENGCEADWEIFVDVSIAFSLCYYTFQKIVKCPLQNSMNAWHSECKLHSLHTMVSQKPPHILIVTSESSSTLSCRCGKSREIKGMSGCWCRATWCCRKSTKWFWRLQLEERRGTSPLMTSPLSVDHVLPLVTRLTLEMNTFLSQMIDYFDYYC